MYAIDYDPAPDEELLAWMQPAAPIVTLSSFLARIPGLGALKISFR